jgi:hypothetical protein
MRHPIIIAGFTIGICTIIAACILSWNLRAVAHDLRAAGAFVHAAPPRFPDTITLRNGNEFFNVQLRNYSGEPIRVEQRPAK